MLYQPFGKVVFLVQKLDPNTDLKINSFGHLHLHGLTTALGKNLMKFNTSLA